MYVFIMPNPGVATVFAYTAANYRLQNMQEWKNLFPKIQEILIWGKCIPITTVMKIIIQQ